MRTLGLTLMMVCLASLAQAQTTLTVVAAGTQVPVTSFAVAPMCNQAVLVETVTRTTRPDTAAWPDPAVPGRDCAADLRATPIATLPPLAPNGYQMSLRMGTSVLGALSTVFLAPAAQVPTIEASKPFRVQASHPCTNATAFRVYVDDAPVGSDLPPTACVSGTVTANHAGVSAGSHTVEISAIDAVSEKRGTPTTIQATAPIPQTVAPGPATVAQP